MSNIPVKDRRIVTHPPQQAAYKNAAPQTRPAQQSRTSQPYTQQMQRPANAQYSRPAQGQNIRPQAPHSSAVSQSAKQPQKGKQLAKKSSILQSLFSHKKKPAAKARRKREHTGLGDFLLSFFIAFVFFGIAAIIVCNALISMFT